MEYINPASKSRQAMILCCQCGTAIEPNAANMCVGCIRTQVDISEGIPKQAILYYCKGCERYLQPPDQWVLCTLESRELLALCLKKLKGLSNVRLVDAGFVWTEPHSKRIKVKLTIQKEVFGGAILQQVFIVEFTVNSQFCDTCHRVEANDFWRSLVQIRQKRDHKKTFFYLEQLILRHKAHGSTVNIKPNHGGLDFFFDTKDHARKLVDFVVSVVPCRYQYSQQLISHDMHSNVFNYKSTFSMELVPICKDDIVCLPAKLANSLGSIRQICICIRVNNTIILMEPNTGQVAELTSTVFWRSPFRALCNPAQLIDYVIMNIEYIHDKDRHRFAGQGGLSMKHALADVWVVKANELGTTDDMQHCRTHLGYILEAGDTVKGFDLANANINDENFEKMKRDNLSDVVIVKKVYGNRASRHQKRKWKLKHLNEETEMLTVDKERDYADFLEDLEEDPAFRKDVNIYKDKGKTGVDVDDTNDDETPRITLQEMMDELTIDEDAAGEDNAPMVE